MLPCKRTWVKARRFRLTIFLMFCGFCIFFNFPQVYQDSVSTPCLSAAIDKDRIEKVIQQLESQSKSVSAEEAKQDLFHLGSRVKSKIGLRIWIDIPNNFPWRNCLTNYNNVVASTQCILKSHTGSTWRIPDWNSSFQLFNTEAKQCLEPAPSDSTTNIIQAIIKDCSEGRWKYNSLGQLSWSNGGCLTAMGAAQGNRVELHPCKDSLQQQRFEFGILDFDPAKNKTLVIPLDLKQWESRQNAYRAKELAEAKTDVLNVVNALNNIKDESKEKRRAVVFYLDKGTGFLAFLKWWILAWKLLGLNSETERFDIVLFTHPDSIQHLPTECVEYRDNENLLMGHGKCLYASMYGIAYRDPRYDNYINSHECLINPSAAFLTQYSHILRSDLDTFPTPGLLGYWPDTVLANKNSAYTFRNSSGTSLITEKLKKAAEYVGLSHKGIHDIGSSWFGPAHLIIKLSSMAVVLSKYLRVYMFGPGSFCRCATCTELPLECTWGSGPYAGTILLYAQELAINQIWDKNQYDSLNKVNVDASTTTDESVCANLHLHVFHGSDRFSKFEFVDGRYKEFNMTGLKLSKARDFAIFLALKSSGQGIGEQEVSARYSIGGDGSLANVCKMDADIPSL